MLPYNLLLIQKKKKKTIRFAFSLVELSIVIIILGLLAVGVMGGMGMVRTAKVNGIITEYRSIKEAINSFLVYRNRLPGDTDRNDIIENHIITSEGIVESLYFWRELQEENLMGSLRYNMPKDITSEKNIVVGITIPSSRYDKTVGWHIMAVFFKNNSNTLILSEFSNNAITRKIDSKIVQGIDKKMDNGEPLTGIIYAINDGDNTNRICHQENNYNNNDGLCSVAFTLRDVSEFSLNSEESVEWSDNVQRCYPSFFGIESWDGSGVDNSIANNSIASVLKYSTGITEVSTPIKAYCIDGTTKYRGCLRFSPGVLNYNGIQIPSEHSLEIKVFGGYGAKGGNGSYNGGYGGNVSGKINRTSSLSLSIYPGEGGSTFSNGARSDIGGKSGFGCNGGGGTSSAASSVYRVGTGGACSAVTINGNLALIAGGGAGGNCSSNGVGAETSKGGGEGSGNNVGTMIGETIYDCNKPGGGGGYVGGKVKIGGSNYVNELLFDETTNLAGKSSGNGYVDICLDF